MDQPIVFDNKPKTVNLVKGEESYFCSCGRSNNQPYCDGSHKGTHFVPKAFTADSDGEAYLCLCKQSANAPYCDGTHKNISIEEVGKAPQKAINETGESIQAVATTEEPTVAFIHQLAREGLSKMGHHGPMTSMGVPRHLLPHWDDLQIMAAQMATKPLMEDVNVGSQLIIGPNAKRPLKLDVPLFVSDMSFGALSEEAKVALARGAQLAGTGICSGEGGMLPEEQAENSRYFYELASAQFGYNEDALKNVQALSLIHISEPTRPY